MIDDDGKLKRKYTNKRVNARKENIECLLTFNEFCDLLRDANLKSSDLGFSGNGYVLARYNDTGPYAVGNCRFITQKQNSDEKIISDAARAASRNNAKLMSERNKIRVKSKEEIEKYSNVMKEYWNGLRTKAAERRREYEKNAHQSYLGNKNSQYGSMWITDGASNKKIHKGDDIPTGWKKGRVLKKLR